MSDPYRENAWRKAPPRPPPVRAVIFGVLTGLASIYGALSLLESADCTTHLLGPADEASIRDARQLDGRIYLSLDAGVLRAEARAAFCSDEAVLRRSGLKLDGGIGVVCEVPQ